MLKTGTVLQDRFLIEQQLAQGGMGAVYLATDQKFGSRVAIKERIYEHADLAEAFEREARILNTLHHPILPHVSDYFSAQGGHFLVMEYIEGEDLCERLKDSGKLAVADVTGWAMELLEGLDYLHSQDPPIIHRDIKPGNLKLTTRGNIVLLDFGLAKETSNGGQGVRSVFGYSRRYSPFEQIEGAGTDVRSDIFSLGATLYHLYTGEAPVDVLSRASAIVAGRPDPLRQAHEIKSDVPVGISQVLQRALELDAGRRFSSATEMRAALTDAIAQRDAVSNDSLPAAAFSDFDDEVETVVEPQPRLKRVERDITEPVVTSRPLHRPQPTIHRAGFWLALAIIGLLGIGYAGLRSFRSSTAAEPATPAVRANENTDIENSEPQPETQSAAENETPSGAPDIASVENEGAPQTVPSTVNEDLDRYGADKRKAVTVENPKPAKTEAKTSDRAEIPGPRESIARAPKRQTSPGRPRPDDRRARRVAIDEPSASTIEMIFTGVPPRQGRRMRRIYPY